MVYRFCILFFFALCALPPFIWRAQAQQPLASASVQPDSCLIGDDVFYTLTVSVASGITVVYPAEGDSAFAPLELRRMEKLPSTVDGNSVTEKIRFVLAAFDTGDVSIPALTLRYSTGAGDGTIETQEKKIYVRSVLSAEQKEIVDIKPPQEIAVPLWIYLAAIGTLIALSVAGYFLYRYFRTRTPPAVTEKSVPVKSAYDEAMEQLAAIEKLPVETPDEVKAYYTVLADTVRSFLERHYRIAAMEEITSEIHTDLLMKRRTSLPEADRIKRLLEKADLVKFAKFTAGKIEAKESLTLAYSVVEVAKPVAETVPPVPTQEVGQESPVLPQP